MRPRLVLVHGSRASAAEWNRYAALLPALEVVAVDLPGHGTRAGEPFTTAAAVAVIADAVAGTDGRPVVVAGHSLGGYMAMVYAAQQPAGLAGLVLLGASADPEGLGVALYKGFAALIPRTNPAHLVRLTNAIGRLLGIRSDDLPDGAAYAALPAAFDAVMSDCHSSLLGDVACPVLIVNGQFDQMRVHARRYRDASSDARVAVVPGATHVAPFTHPHYVSAVLRRFIADVAQPSRMISR